MQNAYKPSCVFASHSLHLAIRLSSPPLEDVSSVSLQDIYLRTASRFFTISHLAQGSLGMSNLTHSFGYGQGYGNATLLANPDLCTLQTCDLSLASFLYLPTVAGNALFAALFGICLVGQLYLGIRYRTWGYMATIVSGLLLEIIGYVARVMLHSSPFDNNDFLMYLICLTIGTTPYISMKMRGWPNMINSSGISNGCNLPLPVTNRRIVWRKSLAFQTAHIHPRFLRLRSHQSRASGFGRSHCFYG